MASPIRSFMAWEAAGGVALLAAAIVALIWANTDPSGYSAFWTTPITIGSGDHALDTTLLQVVNNGLMTLFFLLIGMEVKRELAIGELADRKAAAVPLAAALGGMVLPALVYLAFTAGGPAQGGWGIPMATDVAFALAVLAALRTRVPPSLWALLLGVAVIDDIGAIIVIALAYSGGLNLAWLAAAIGALVLFGVLTRMHVQTGLPYIALGLLAWAFTAASGVHATIAGVAVGLLMPAIPRRRPTAEPGDEAVSPLARTVRALHPWSSFVILPIFALANAGIVFGTGTLAAEGAAAAALGIGLGLLVGKAAGLSLGAWLAVRSGIGVMPQGARWSQILGIGLVAGVGFTVSLFITDLAFGAPGLSDAARLGVFGGSVVAAVAGATVLWTRGRPECEAT